MYKLQKLKEEHTPFTPWRNCITPLMDSCTIADPDFAKDYYPKLEDYSPIYILYRRDLQIAINVPPIQQAAEQFKRHTDWPGDPYAYAKHLETRKSREEARTPSSLDVLASLSIRK